MSRDTRPVSGRTALAELGGPTAQPPGLVAGALVDLQAVLAEQVAQPGAECLEFRAEPVNRNVGLA